MWKCDVFLRACLTTGLRYILLFICIQYLYICTRSIYELVIVVERLVVQTGGGDRWHSAAAALQAQAKREAARQYSQANRQKYREARDKKAKAARVGAALASDGGRPVDSAPIRPAPEVPSAVDITPAAATSATGWVHIVRAFNGYRD